MMSVSLIRSTMRSVWDFSCCVLWNRLMPSNAGISVSSTRRWKRSRLIFAKKESRALTDWRTFLRTAKDLAADGDVIAVTLGDGRSQRVRVSETTSTYEFSSTVVRAAALSEVPQAPLRAWRRNRSSQGVGFRIDGRGVL